MEFLYHSLLWWHWIAFGLLLVIAEIIVPLFVVIWFGLGAIVVGIVKFLFLTSFMTEISIWLLSSLLFLSIWWFFLRDKNVDKSGLAEYRLDTIGTVTQKIIPHQKGKVHFDIPVLGSSDWYAISDEMIDVGERVKIVEVNGQLIKVKKES